MTRFFGDLLLPSIDLEAVENPRPLVRAGLLAVAVLALLVGAWLALAPLGGAAIAPGVVKVDMNRKTVQHQEGGIVDRILVRDGTKVQAGQTLIVLADVRVDAGSELVQSQLDAELAKAARLSAEQAWTGDIAFPPELLTRSKERRVREFIERERALFRARRASYDNQVALIGSEIKETRAEVTARDLQLEADRKAIKLQREELAANEGLLDQGFVSKTRLIALRRSVAELEGHHGDSEAERARAVQKIADLQLRAESLRSNLMQDAASELRQASTQIFDLRERLRPAQDAESRLRIKAPIAGEVVGLRITSIGAVIGPREPILDIVPDAADLIVETRLRPEDISYVHEGARADVRLTAFRQRLTPTVRGEVTYVSADRMEDRDARLAYYVAHVRVTPQALQEAGRLHLQAGMPAEVFIRTSSRTTLEYLFDPISGFVQRSMRER